MAWCKECKCEYEATVKVCAECGSELVEYLKNEKAPDEKFESIQYELLVEVSHNVKADFIIAILEEANIPVQKKYKSSGQYLNILMGFNFQGVGLYVPNECLEKANALLEDIDLSDTLEEGIEDEALEALEKKYKNRNKAIARITIYGVFIIPLIILIIYELVNLIVD